MSQKQRFQRQRLKRTIEEPENITENENQNDCFLHIRDGNCIFIIEHQYILACLAGILWVDSELLSARVISYENKHNCQGSKSTSTVVHLRVSPAQSQCSKSRHRSFRVRASCWVVYISDLILALLYAPPDHGIAAGRASCGHARDHARGPYKECHWAGREGRAGVRAGDGGGRGRAGGRRRRRRRDSGR